MDRASSWMMLALFVVGILLILVDVALMAGFILQNKGVSLAWWFAGSTPTPIHTPAAEPTLATPTPTVTSMPTAVALTATAVPPTATSEPTATAVPPTPTPTIEPTATATRVVQPTASPTPAPAIVDWRGEYFDNVGLIGVASVVRNDRTPDGTSGLSFDWGQNAPAAGLPADGFSARWTRVLGFDEGLYRFRAVADDGLRLYIDGDLVIDQWRDGGRREATVDRRMTAGKHTLRIEYYEQSGAATVQVSWEKTSSYSDWKGEYWANVGLQGTPAIVRNDKSPDGTLGIDFDWKEASPANGIPIDNFGARWTRPVLFDAATYRFHVLADDGVRLWVDGQLLIDKWQDQGATEFTAKRTLVQGTHAVKIEYYDRSGGARIKLWWEKVELSISDWKGEYWSNRNLDGNPALVRNDKDSKGTSGIDFNWGINGPATGLPVDRFSVRWTRQVTLKSGTYRFFAWADDGVRVAVDGKWIINEWHDAANEIYTNDVSLDGTHKLKVEYYERGGTAAVRFWWKRVGD
ncbi:MAG: hypothetical protein JXA89_00435 [Anaerolineae bacterium]|nr:hypothetical protein [Anaerolineae bacterium]